MESLVVQFSEKLLEVIPSSASFAMFRKYEM